MDDVAARFVMGTGAVLASGHWVDFSATVKIGDHVIVGGRNSSFWTHNRQRGRSIGPPHRLGLEVRVAPGNRRRFALLRWFGAFRGYESPRVLIGGNPARSVRDLREPDLFLVVRGSARRHSARGQFGTPARRTARHRAQGQRGSTQFQPGSERHRLVGRRSRMCGIAGILDLKGRPVDPIQVRLAPTHPPRPRRRRVSRRWAGRSRPTPA